MIQGPGDTKEEGVWIKFRAMDNEKQNVKKLRGDL